jgi:hypothetical protein
MYQKVVCLGTRLILLLILTMLPSLVESLAQHHVGEEWMEHPTFIVLANSTASRKTETEKLH